MEEIILQNGYVKLSHGYKKVTIDDGCSIEHFVTLFSGSKVQLFSYYENSDEGKIYDTSIVEMTPEILQTFINVLVK
jgi:hypothetical protein